MTREEIFERNNAFLLYDLHGHALAHEPLPWGHEINNLSKLFIGHDYSLSDLCLGLEKEFFFKNCSFSLYDLYGHTPAQEPQGL